MASPLNQFAIITYFPLKLGGIEIPFTNSALAMFIGSMLQIGFFLLLPKRFAFFKETGEIYYQFIADLVFTCAGKKAEFLVPFASTVFSTIFFGNIIGLIPSIFTFTSHLIPNLVLSMIVMATVITVGFYRNGLSFLGIFWPSGVPFIINILIMTIEVFTFLIRPFSLCLRLSMNMIIGHLILKIILTIGGILGSAQILIAPVYLFIFTLETLVAFLQAYIFTIMTCVYLKDAVESHH